MVSTMDLGLYDVRSILAAAGELAECAAAARPARVRPLLEAVGRLVPCDSVSWSRMDLDAAEQLGAVVELGYDCTVEEDAALVEAWWAYHAEHPLWGRAEPAVVTIGNVCSTQEWRRNAHYQNFSRLAGIEHDMRVSLRHPPRQTHVLLLTRGPGLDFSERDSLVMTLLRPHLEAAIGRATTRPRVTAREREILTLVSDGYSNADIARQLHLSTGTVRKHLENVFGRLDVHSRTAAVAAVSDLL